MKRTIAILLCLFLIGTLALSVSAASAHMSLSSSAGTVYRGDTFTLTVTLSNDQPVSNGGIVLSYDSNAFELLGGSCSVSNATLAEVSAANGGGVFLLQNDAVVSGTIFTINMKVKSNAPFGSYSISGTPSLSIDCSIAAPPSPWAASTASAKPARWTAITTKAPAPSAARLSRKPTPGTAAP